MSEVGRPTKYKVEYNEQVEKLCKLGATDKEIADFFDIAESTVNEWKLTYPEFSESIKRGKLLADANVSESLYKRAIGCVLPDTDIKMYEGQIIETPLKKHYPPDTAAAIFWLNNRRKENWRNRHDLDLTTNGKELNSPNLSHIPLEDLIKLRDGHPTGNQTGDSSA